jgi:hypothetical protein
MTSDADASEEVARIAIIADALVEQFGINAILVAEKQAQAATGQAAERWYAILSYLKASS